MRKTTRDGTEEVWLEKTYYTTEQAFPTVLRRSEVVSLDIIEMSPLETALQEVEEKTKELVGLRLKYEALAKTMQEVSTNALAMSLNTAVDAPLNSGIASYRQIFFSPDYVARNPERAELVEKLRIAIDEQVRIIDGCLKLHGLLCPPEFIPFHETLEKFFRKNFRDEIRQLAADGMSDSITVSTRSHAYAASAYEPSAKRSASSSTSTARFVIPPLNVGRGLSMTPPLESPVSPGAASSVHHGVPGGGGSGAGAGAGAGRTPLQRHLAHLARHGINGVASAPGDVFGGGGIGGGGGGADSLSADSPHNSFVNVGGGSGGVHAAHASGASVAGSYMGSIGSFGSLKGRFSRFPSLNFGRKQGAPRL